MAYFRKASGAPFLAFCSNHTSAVLYKFLPNSNLHEWRKKIRRVFQEDSQWKAKYLGWNSKPKRTKEGGLDVHINWWWFPWPWVFGRPSDNQWWETGSCVTLAKSARWISTSSPVKKRQHHLVPEARRRTCWPAQASCHYWCYYLLRGMGINYSSGKGPSSAK